MEWLSRKYILIIYIYIYIYCKCAFLSFVMIHLLGSLLIECYFFPPT